MSAGFLFLLYMVGFVVGALLLAPWISWAASAYFEWCQKILNR